MEQQIDDQRGIFAQLRCFNHAQREAAARCPECGRFFCRECVSEHRNRFLCASCIAEEATEAQVQPKSYLGRLRPVFRIMIGMLVLWMLFFVMGKALFSVPSTFHDRDSLAVEGSEESDRP
jgi:hypothetical protein